MTDEHYICEDEDCKGELVAEVRPRIEGATTMPIGENYFTCRKCGRSWTESEAKAMLKQG